MGSTDCYTSKQVLMHIQISLSRSAMFFKEIFVIIVVSNIGTCAPTVNENTADDTVDWPDVDTTVTDTDESGDDRVGPCWTEPRREPRCRTGWTWNLHRGRCIRRRGRSGRRTISGKK